MNTYDVSDIAEMGGIFLKVMIFWHNFV